MALLKRIFGFFRFLLFGIYTLLCMILAWLFVSILRMGADTGLMIRQVCARGLLFILGFRVILHGKSPTDGPYLFVCNHRSALDPIILLSYIRGFPVSKVNVRKYPIVGIGVKITGAIFVEKQNTDSRNATKEAIYDTLKSGHSVVIFPEGRTNTAPLSMLFQKGSFEQAAALGVPVVPIALEYQDKKCYWDHQESIVEHYFTYMNKWRLPVKLMIGKPIIHDDGMKLLDISKMWIDQQIVEMRAAWGE